MIFQVHFNATRRQQNLSYHGSILLKSSREESELFSLYSSGTSNTKHDLMLKVHKTVQGQEIFLSNFKGGILLILGECTIIYLYLNILFQIVIKTFNIHFLALSKRDMDSRFYFFLAQSQCWIQLSFINFPR